MIRLTQAIILLTLHGCGYSEGDDRQDPIDFDKETASCTGENCASATGVVCIDNAVNIAALNSDQAVKLCSNNGRDDLYICVQNAVSVAELSTDNAVKLCDNNNTNRAYQCVINGVHLANLTSAQALNLCDTKATDNGYLCYQNGMDNLSGITTDQAIELCKNGNDTDAFSCVVDQMTDGALDLEEAIAICSTFAI